MNSINRVLENESSVVEKRKKLVTAFELRYELKKSNCDDDERS